MEIDRIEGQYPPLRPQKRPGTPAPVLREGNPSSVGFEAEHIDAIRLVCRQWAKDGKQPLVTLVARRGVVVLHEAFGTKDDGTHMTTHDPTSMASITKLMTGTLLMKFVDHGPIDLDAPLNKYLPQLNRDVEKHITIRHLMTHTSGFSGPSNWGHDWNHSLENQFGQYLPYLEVGSKFTYTGFGYAVVGKVMERITGRAIPYLFQEHLFAPLGAHHMKVAGTGGDATSICLDMARLSQMLGSSGFYVGSPGFGGSGTYA